MEANDFVESHWWDLEFHGEMDMAKSLFYNFSIRGKSTAYVIEVWKGMPKHVEAEVAQHFTEMLGPQLNAMTQSQQGQVMLDVLYDAMITGSPDSSRRKQANLILSAKAEKIGPKKYLRQERRNPEGKRTQIFPVGEMHLTPGHNDAPFKAVLLSDGQIQVRYPARVQHDFPKEEATILGNPFSGDGVTLPADEIVGIKDIDNGGMVQYLPALALIDYSNRIEHSTLGKIAQVSLTAFTMGIGGPAAGAANAGKWAARFALANDIAQGVQIVSTLIQENRSFLIKKLGGPGEALVKASEIADSAIAIFGVLQLGVAGFELAASLRAAVRDIGEEPALLRQLSSDEVDTVGEITSKTNALAEDLEKGAAAAKADAEAAGKLTSINPDGSPGRSYPTRTRIVDTGTQSRLVEQLGPEDNLLSLNPPGRQISTTPAGTGSSGAVASDLTSTPAKGVSTSPPMRGSSPVGAGNIRDIKSAKTYKPVKATSAHAPTASTHAPDTQSSIVVGPNDEALKIETAPAPVPDPVPQPVPDPNPATPASTQAAATPRPVPGATGAQNAVSGVSKVAIKNESKKKKKKEKKDPCDHALPIRWPHELPMPLYGNTIVRKGKEQRESEGIERGKPQRDLSRCVRNARQRGLEIEHACADFGTWFDPDLGSNTPADAHHIHPMYLGGDEGAFNLGVLDHDRHTKGHRRLDNQIGMINTPEWQACRPITSELKNNPEGQEFTVIGKK